MSTDLALGISILVLVAVLVWWVIEKVGDRRGDR